MKNKILLEIEEFLQTNKEILLVALSVIIFFALPMIVFGVEKTIIGMAKVIGVVVWCGVFAFLLHFVLFKLFDKF